MRRAGRWADGQEFTCCAVVLAHLLKALREDASRDATRGGGGQDRNLCNSSVENRWDFWVDCGWEGKTVEASWRLGFVVSSAETGRCTEGNVRTH